MHLEQNRLLTSLKSIQYFAAGKELVIVYNLVRMLPDHAWIQFQSTEL
jgi:hypothetical protein